MHTVDHKVNVTDENEETMNEKIDAILASLTLDEKIKLLAGTGHQSTFAIEEKGIPALICADGAMGVHSQGIPATAYPASIAWAASFNEDLAYRIGEALARDCRDRGVDIMLGPGVNLYRAPQCGRNFEYLGEDPVLAAQIAVAFIKGLQENGVAATIKHYALNYQEFDRHGVSSDCDDRTLREVYLPVFEAAVKEAGVWCVMTAYNLVNGEHCSEHRVLVRDILKREWNFDGVVMSDWTSTYNAVQAANHGLDLEMPTGKFLNSKKLLPALENGLVTEATINDKVKRLLRLMDRLGKLDAASKAVVCKDDPPSGRDALSAEVALDAAREGIVLLKNEAYFLPLRRDKIQKIAVLGYQAGHPVISGGGSAHGRPYDVLTLEQAVRQLAGEDVDVSYHLGVNPWRFKDVIKQSRFDGGLQCELFNNNRCAGVPAVTRTDGHLNWSWMNGAAPHKAITAELFSVRWTGGFLPEHTGEHVIYSSCMDGGYRLYVNDELQVDPWWNEDASPKSTYLNCTAGERVSIRVEFRKARHWAGMYLGWEATTGFDVDRNAAIIAAKQADIVVFAAGFVNKVEGEGFDHDFAMHPAIESFLLDVADINPNTIVTLYAGGNVDMNRWLSKVRALLHLWYPGQNGCLAAAEILFGDTNPSGKLPVSFEKRFEDRSSHDSYFDRDQDRHVQIADGAFGAYRHFDKTGIKPAFPFGFGLSYTRFEYTDLELGVAGDGLEASFVLTNVGDRPGAEAALLFVSDVESTLPRPVKELKRVAKRHLEPGESRRVSIAIRRDMLQYFDPDQQQWVLEPGEFRILIAANAADIRLQAKFCISQDLVFAIPTPR